MLDRKFLLYIAGSVVQVPFSASVLSSKKPRSPVCLVDAMGVRELLKLLREIEPEVCSCQIFVGVQIWLLFNQ